MQASSSWCCGTSGSRLRSVRRISRYGTSRSPNSKCQQATKAHASIGSSVTRDFGVRWEPRRDGHGREIADVRQALMETFSSRRASIGPLAARRRANLSRSSGARRTHACWRAWPSGPITRPGARRGAATRLRRARPPLVGAGDRVRDRRAWVAV